MTNYYAVQFPTYQRAMRNILSITQDFPALVTTTFDGLNPGEHQYSSGLIIRFVIPDGYGMKILDKQQAEIIVINATQFTVSIDTTQMDPFVLDDTVPTPAQTIPFGENNSILTMATKNVLPYI